MASGMRIVTRMQIKWALIQQENVQVVPCSYFQVLSKLEIVIPLYFIFSVFREGIRPKADKIPKRGSVSQSGGDSTKDVICKRNNYL